MGRSEAPIVTDNRALRQLAEWLREQRRRAGWPSYRQLAVRAGCHATTLQRAAGGKKVPKLSVVLAYARSCDASLDQAQVLWKRARQEAARSARGGRPLAAPRPRLVRDFADLSAALRELYEQAGSPALRTMEQRAGAFGSLPRSTAHRIVNRRAMPHSPEQFRAFLRACEVPEQEQPEWEAAWSRAWRHEKQETEAVEVEVLRVPVRQFSPWGATVEEVGERRLRWTEVARPEHARGGAAEVGVDSFYPMFADEPTADLVRAAAAIRRRAVASGRASAEAVRAPRQPSGREDRSGDPA